MGTINYNTSDYITLGIEPYDPDPATWDFSDYDFIPDIYDVIQQYYEEDYANATEIISHYALKYYHITVQYDYYEGIYIDIENNYGVCYDEYTDRQNAQKEITQIRKLLMELNGIGFRACYPGWATRFLDYEQTNTAVDNAIREMRLEAKATPTWRQLNCA